MLTVCSLQFIQYIYLWSCGPGDKTSNFTPIGQVLDLIVSGLSSDYVAECGLEILSLLPPEY